MFAYYALPSWHTLPQQIDAFRNRIGAPIFVVGTIWLVSILVPEIAKKITKSESKPLTWKDLVLRMTYFALVGLSVDYLYQLMGHYYGQGPHFDVIAKKFLTDMFVYSPLVSMPLGALTFLYQDSDFSWRRTVQALREGEFLKRMMPLLVTCWMYFGPVTIAMYSLPVELNYPVAMAANAAWGIIVVSVGTHKK